MNENIDKILEFTPTWISTNKLFQKVGGNKSAFLRKLKQAESDGYIDMKQCRVMDLENDLSLSAKTMIKLTLV